MWLRLPFSGLRLPACHRLLRTAIPYVRCVAGVALPTTSLQPICYCAHAASLPSADYQYAGMARGAMQHLDVRTSVPGHGCLPPFAPTPSSTRETVANALTNNSTVTLLRQARNATEREGRWVWTRSQASWRSLVSSAHVPRTHARAPICSVACLDDMVPLRYCNMATRRHTHAPPAAHYLLPSLSVAHIP